LDRLKGKVALITGVARPRGQAYAVAKVFGRENAALAVVDISDEVWKRVKELKALGYDVLGFKADLTKSRDVNDMVEQIMDKYGKVDILCNVVGLGPHPWHSFLEMTEDEWDTILNINLKTVYYCCKAVVPSMVKQRYGKIVNWSSTTGPMVTLPNTTHYSAAKGGVSGFTRALALELAPYNITVNAILPGSIRTSPDPMTERRKRIDKAIPLGYGQPEDTADLALFLASDESKYITGTEIVLDGGDTIQERKTA
jgi:3-oxoacyl-[acyl-carrier protein] reductase